MPQHPEAHKRLDGFPSQGSKKQRRLLCVPSAPLPLQLGASLGGDAGTRHGALHTPPARGGQLAVSAAPHPLTRTPPSPAHQPANTRPPPPGGEAVFFSWGLSPRPHPALLRRPPEETSPTHLRPRSENTRSLERPGKPRSHSSGLASRDHTRAAWQAATPSGLASRDHTRAAWQAAITQRWTGIDRNLKPIPTTYRYKDVPITTCSSIPMLTARRGASLDLYTKSPLGTLHVVV